MINTAELKCCRHKALWELWGWRKTSRQQQQQQQENLDGLELTFSAGLKDVEQPRVKPKPSVGFTEAVYFHVISDYKQSKLNILLLSSKNVRAGPY